jgi:hypothetical protein
VSRRTARTAPSHSKCAFSPQVCALPLSATRSSAGITRQEQREEGASHLGQTGIELESLGPASCRRRVDRGRGRGVTSSRGMRPREAGEFSIALGRRLVCAAASAAALTLLGSGGGESWGSPGGSLASTSGTSVDFKLARAQAAAGVIDHGALVTDWRRGGLWIVSPQGEKQRLLRRGKRPIAVGGTRRIAVAPLRQYGPITMIKGKRRVVLPHSDRKRVCATWSRNGRRIAYIAGKNAPYKRYPRPSGRRGSGNVAVGIKGSLWVAKASRPRDPKRVASGLFPECAAWSPRGQAVAYLVRSKSDRRAWRLRVRGGGRTRRVATSHTVAPSIHDPDKNRSFAWDGKDSLFYLDDRGLYRVPADGGGRVKLTPRSELRPLFQAAQELGIPGTAHDRIVRVSPDGRHVALSIRFAGTGVTSVDSGGFTPLITTSQPSFSGWAGSQSLLAVVKPPGPEPLSLTLYPIDGSPGEALAGPFKSVVVEDPSGEWFAWGSPQPREITFHRPDGSVLNQRALRFNPPAVAAIDESGRVSTPAWP